MRTVWFGLVYFGLVKFGLVEFGLVEFGLVDLGFLHGFIWTMDGKKKYRKKGVGNRVAAQLKIQDAVYFIALSLRAFLRLNET